MVRLRFPLFPDPSQINFGSLCLDGKSKFITFFSSRFPEEGDGEREREREREKGSEGIGEKNILKKV